MSTSSLPAGFQITSINGKRCTAVPRSVGAANSFANSTTAAAVAAGSQAVAVAAPVAITSSTSTSSSSTSILADASTPPPAVVAPAEFIQTGNAAPSSTVTVAAAATDAAQTTPSTTTTDSTTSTPPSDTPLNAANVVNDPNSQAPVAAQTPSSSDTPTLTPTSTPDIPTPSPTTDGESTDSSNPTSAQPNVQSEITPDPTTTTDVLPLGGFITAPSSSLLSSASTQIPAQPASSAVSSGNSSPKTSMGAIVGGVVGSFAFLGFIGILLWWFMRKRRNSRYIPPDNGFQEKTYYEIDAESVGPTNRFVKFKAQAGSSIERFFSNLKAKANGQPDTPSVNMDRGNSQFLESLPQLSRSTTMVNGRVRGVTTLDRIKDWWTRVTADVNFNWRILQKEKEADSFPFMREGRGRSGRARGTSLPRSTDFSNFLSIKDDELRAPGDRRRSQSLGSLGLDFSNISRDPFADPVTGNSNLAKTLTLDPFADPLTEPKSAATRTSPGRASGNYVHDVRRSRGQSVDRTASQDFGRSVASNADGRYSTANRVSKDSFGNRDTMYSSFSTNGRKGKGRSDPFDLERPEFWRAAAQAKARQSKTLSDVEESKSIESAGREEDERMNKINSYGMQPRVVSMRADQARVVSEVSSYGSKYSSGMSAVLSEWGDPGPDIGPFAGRQQQQSNLGVGVARGGNVSPALSELSNKTNGVGKAL